MTTSPPDVEKSAAGVASFRLYPTNSWLTMPYLTGTAIRTCSGWLYVGFTPPPNICQGTETQPISTKVLITCKVTGAFQGHAGGQRSKQHNQIPQGSTC